MNRTTRILSIEKLTTNVYRLRIEKPTNYSYTPGQATDLTLQLNQDTRQTSSFSITSIPSESFLEFIIKVFNPHNKFLQKLLSSKAGDSLLVSESFGGIPYKGEGLFIAGGSGIAPFISILKTLKQEDKLGRNRVIFANRTEKDIILNGFFEELLGNRFITILSEEENANHDFGFVTIDYLNANNPDKLNYYYLCGPGPMLDGIEKGLLQNGVKAEYILKESF